MKTKFCCLNMSWDRARSEISFDGAYLSVGPKKFEISCTKRIVLKNEKLYLCKVKIAVGRHIDETFKMFVLNDDTIKNFRPEDIQLIGYNKGGNFIIDKEFADGIKKASASVMYVKLDKGEDESQKFSKDT